jgi:hypothetical protein
LQQRLVSLLQIAFVATTVACEHERPIADAIPDLDASVGRDASRDPAPSSDLDASLPPLDASAPLDASVDLDASTPNDAAPDSDASSIPDPPPLVEETFSGTIERFYSDFIYHTFQSNAGEVRVRVTSVIEPPDSIQTSIGVAVYHAKFVDAGYECDRTRLIGSLFSEFQLDNGSYLSAQLEAGWYCLDIFDGGQLPDGVTGYTVVVSHP